MKKGMLLFALFVFSFSFVLAVDNPGHSAGQIDFSSPIEDYIKTTLPFGSSGTGNPGLQIGDGTSQKWGIYKNTNPNQELRISRYLSSNNPKVVMEFLYDGGIYIADRVGVGVSPLPSSIYHLDVAGNVKATKQVDVISGEGVGNNYAGFFTRDSANKYSWGLLAGSDRSFIIRRYGLDGNPTGEVITISNANGNIGINGAPDSTNALKVTGSILATGNVRTPSICDENGGNCKNVADLSTSSGVWNSDTDGINYGGRVGVNGVSDPAYALKVTGKIKATAEICDGQGNCLNALPASKITSESLHVDRIPNLDASKITTGTLNVARIPNLDASKITTGNLNVNSVSSDTGVFSAGQGYNLRLRTAGSDKLTIEGSTGNVGIGTAPSSYKLDVEGSLKTALISTGSVTLEDAASIYYSSTPELSTSISKRYIRLANSATTVATCSPTTAGFIYFDTSQNSSQDAIPCVCVKLGGVYHWKPIDNWQAADCS